jgi:hypothetical protein
MIRQIVESINDWLQSLNFDMNNIDPWKLTFHLPLHRYLSVFAYNAIFKYHIDPGLFLPIDNSNLMLNLMFHPLRTIVSRERETEESLGEVWILFSVDIMKFYRIFGFEMVNK